MVYFLIILLLILLLLILLWLWWRGRDVKLSEAHYASGWSVNNNADWTPFPPNANPLGPPNDACTGGVIVGSWAHFTFPQFGLPAGSTVTGIMVRFKYLSQSGSNTVQLTNGGTLVGNSKPIASVAGPSRCSSTKFTSVGGDGDTWGTNFAVAAVNAAAVGVRITQNANTVDIDAVELTVCYST